MKSIQALRGMYDVLRSAWEALPNTSSRTTFYATIACATNWRQPKSVLLTLEVRASMPLCSVTVPVRQHYVFDRFAEQLVLAYVAIPPFVRVFERHYDSAVVMGSYCASKSSYFCQNAF